MMKTEVQTIRIPGDLFSTMEEMESYAIFAAREESPLYIVPCNWHAELISGEIGNHEIEFRVTRTYRG